MPIAPASSARHRIDWKMFLGLSLVAAAGFWLLVIPYAGGMARDLRLSGSWHPAYDLRTIEGRCTRHQLILTTCEVTLGSLADPGAAPVRIGFMMGLVGGGGEPLVPMRSSRDPSAVTVGYAAETELVNRALTFVFMTFGFVVIALAALATLRNGRPVGDPDRLASPAQAVGEARPAGGGRAEPRSFA